MKKLNILSLLLVLLFSLNLMGQANKPTTIKGNISSKYNAITELMLNTIVNGKTVPLSKINVSKDGSFKFTFTPGSCGDLLYFSH